MVSIKEIFLVFSSTPYKMGKFIRFFTKEKYNHVSFSFGEDLSRAYTFARKYVNTPFYGGLVCDSPERYRYNGKKADIALCKIQIGDGAYIALENAVCKAYAEKDKYIYNFYSALSAIRKKKISVKNAYTCVEFAVYLLSLCHVGIDTDTFYSVDSLKRIFESNTVYSGKENFPETARGIPNNAFGEKIDFFIGLRLTCKNLRTLYLRRHHK